MTGQFALKYFEFTPIANLITEPILFMVRTESPIANSKDLAQRLKADPAAVSIALANARGNAFHITAALFARAAGADAKKLKIVVYTSSGDAVAALLGGHVDVVAVTPGNFLPLFEAKKIRILGLGSARRSGGLLATVPTFKEQGFDVVFDLPRSVMGARGLTPEQVRYWDGVFGRMVKTDAWRQAVEKNQWEDDYLNSAGSRQKPESAVPSSQGRADRNRHGEAVRTANRCLSSPSSAHDEAGTHFRADARCVASAAAAQNSYQDCADCPEMVGIPAGRFVMGAAPGEEAREGLAEGFRHRSEPQHAVEIERFSAGKFEVTRGQYRVFAESTGARRWRLFCLDRRRIRAGPGERLAQPGLRAGRPAPARRASVAMTPAHTRAGSANGPARTIAC